MRAIWVVMSIYIVSVVLSGILFQYGLDRLNKKEGKVIWFTIKRRVIMTGDRALLVLAFLTTIPVVNTLALLGFLILFIQRYYAVK